VGGLHVPTYYQARGHPMLIRIGGP